MGAVFLLLVASVGDVERPEAVQDGLHTQLANYRARTYDPSLGRFLQRDPIGIWGDGINFGNGYGYVGEDPGNGRDPEGEKGEYRRYECELKKVNKYVNSGSSPTMPYDEHNGEKLCKCECEFDCGECPRISCAIKKSVGPNTGLVGAWYNMFLAKWEDQDFEGEPVGEVNKGINYRSIITSECSESSCPSLAMTCRYSVPDDAVCDSSAFVINSKKAANLAMVFGAMFRVAAGTVDGVYSTVSRWGGSGLKSGNWVMKGPASLWNWLKSGKWQPGGTNQYAPFNSGQQFSVPTFTLKPTSAAPNASIFDKGIFGWVKNILGQRVYR